MNTTEYKIWKTLRLYVFSKKKILQAIKDCYHIGDKIEEFAHTDNILYPRKMVQDLDLYQVKSSDFFGNEYTSLREFFDRLTKEGFVPCPQSTGFYLRTDYVDQPENEDLMIWSDPIKFTDEKGSPRYFRISTFVEGKRIEIPWYSPAQAVAPDDIWIVSRKKSS